MIVNFHINKPSGYYIGQVKRFGARRFETVTRKCKTGESAMSKAASKMHGYHSARVLFITDWYEPTLIMEAKR